MESSDNSESRSKFSVVKDNPVSPFSGKASPLNKTVGTEPSDNKSRPASLPLAGLPSGLGQSKINDYRTAFGVRRTHGHLERTKRCRGKKIVHACGGIKVELFKIEGGPLVVLTPTDRHIKNDIGSKVQIQISIHTKAKGIGLLTKLEASVTMKGRSSGKGYPKGLGRRVEFERKFMVASGQLVHPVVVK
eukprot:gene16033-biopygen6299